MSDVLDRAMRVETQAEADACFEELIVEKLKEIPDREKAEEAVRFGLGYFAGYFSRETRLRVERLFRCEHPVLGRAADGVPDPDEIFRIGMRLAEARTRGAT